MSCPGGDWALGAGPMDDPVACVCAPDCDEQDMCPEPGSCVTGVEVGPGQYADVCVIQCEDQSDCDEQASCESVGPPFGQICIFVA